MEVSLINRDSRNKNLKNQIYLSVLLRGVSVFLSFYVVRMTLAYLGKDFYGIWIVLLSIVSWIALFDIGIANGLRNKLTISLAANDKLETKKNISTAYFSILCLGVLVFLITVLFTFTLNWQIILNNQLLSNKEYQILLLIFFFSITISFILSMINALLNAFQKSALTNLGNIITNLFFIIALIVWRKYFEFSIIKMMAVYGASSILGNFSINFAFFLNKKELLPSITYFSKEKISEILSLGGSFFIIQIAVLLIFTVDNFLIIQLLKPIQVTIYNIVFKLFSIFTVGFGIIISPFWSAFTEANEKKDFIWMRSTLLKLNKFLIIIVISLVIFLFYYQEILDLWLPSNQRITPQFSLIFCFCLFILISIWNNIYAFFLNGVGIIKVQVRTAIIGAVINIPLAIVFTKYLNFGLSGIVLAMCASLVLFTVFGPISTYRYFKLHA